MPPSETPEARAPAPVPRASLAILLLLYAIALAVRFAGMHPLMTGGDPHDRMRESVGLHREGFRVGEGSLFAGGAATGRPKLYAALLALGYRVQGEASVAAARRTGFAVTALAAPLGYALVLRLSRRRLAALLAGLALATASLLVKEAGEINYAAFVPVFFLATLERLHAFLESRRTRAYALALAAGLAAAYVYTPGMVAAALVLGTGAWTLRLRALPFLLAAALVFALFPYDVLGRGYARYFSEGTQAASAGALDLLIERVRTTFRYLFPATGEGWSVWPWLGLCLLWTLPGLAFLRRTWATGLLLGAYWSPYLFLPPIFPGAIAAVAALLLALLFAWLGCWSARAPRLGTAALLVAGAALLGLGLRDTTSYLRAVRAEPAAVFPRTIDSRPLSAWLAANLPADARIATRVYADQLYVELPPTFRILGIAEEAEDDSGVRLSLDEALARPEPERTALLAQAVAKSGAEYWLVPTRDEGIARGFTHGVAEEVVRLAPALGAEAVGAPPIRVGGAEYPVSVLRFGAAGAPTATRSPARAE